MTPKEHALETLVLVDEVGELVNRALIAPDTVDPWRPLYDLVFSSNGYAPLIGERLAFDYYDPDTSYKADVLAWWSAVNEAAEALRVLVGPE